MLCLASVGLVVVGTRRLPPVIRLELGAFDGDAIHGAWSNPARARLKPEETDDGIVSFYYRTLTTHAELSLPLVGLGSSQQLALRCRPGMRSEVNVYRRSQRVASFTVPRSRWNTHAVDLERGDGAVQLGLSFVPRPLVRGASPAGARTDIDWIEVRDSQGFRIHPAAAAVLVAAVLTLGVVALALGASPLLAGVVAFVGAAAAVFLAHLSLPALLLALPRLLPVALASSGVVALALGPARHLCPADRRALAALVGVGVLFHGSLAFLPDHNPPDLETHIARTRDLGTVPFEYDALLAYASHLPTPSQAEAPATDLFGDKVLLPYSALFYPVYYVLGLAFDMRWVITVFTAAMVMGVGPVLFVAAHRIWGRTAAWMTAILFVLDVAVWHHVGRAHAPAAFGNALGTAALALVAMRAAQMDKHRVVLGASLALGVAAMGYASQAVLLGLVGSALIALVLFDARELSAAARRGLIACFVGGGLMAGGLYYFHYVPGLLREAGGVAAQEDLFPGRTFWIFHNESRQSLRIWILGFQWWVVAGFLAMPLALRRAGCGARPVLMAWLVAWAALMLLKEPFLFPKVLRWAKEDQFLSPLLALFIGGAVQALPRPWMRPAVGGALVAGAAALQLRDFLYHANSLQL